MIDAWVSIKSRRLKDGTAPKDCDDGSGMLNFKGEKHSNATLESMTDPQSRLMRKGNAQPAQLRYGGHVLTEIGNGRCADVLAAESTKAEYRSARFLFSQARPRHNHSTRLAADKGFREKEVVAHLREHRIRPHIARTEARKRLGLDARTTRTEACRISRRKRKRVEEIFGCLKPVGGMLKRRFTGQAKTQFAAFFCSAAHNLLRTAEFSALEAKAEKGRPKRASQSARAANSVNRTGLEIRSPEQVAARTRRITLAVAKSRLCIAPLDENGQRWHDRLRNKCVESH